MGRRLAGEGTVRQRPDGRWEARFRVSREGGGTRQVSAYGTTAAEALAAKAAKLAALKAGEPISRRVGQPVATQGWTLAQAIDGYLAYQVEMGRWEPTTYQSMSSSMKWVREGLGHIQLDKLSRRDVLGFWGQQRRRRPRPRAQGAIHRVSSYLRAVLRWASIEGKFQGDPAAVVPSEPRGEAEREGLEIGQVRRYLAALEGHEHEALFILPMLGTLRFGEVAGLTWADIELSEGEAVLRVRHGLTRVPKRVADMFGVEVRNLKAPKTPAGRRTILLPSVATAALLRHRERQQACYASQRWTWTPDVRVFSGQKGGPIDPSDTGRRWHAFQAEMGVPRDQHIPYHSLRHTAATLEIGAGMPRVTQGRMGHTKLAQTLEYQRRVELGAQRLVTNYVEAQLAQSS